MLGSQNVEIEIEGGWLTSGAVAGEGEKIPPEPRAALMPELDCRRILNAGTFQPCVSAAEIETEPPDATPNRPLSSTREWRPSELQSSSLHGRPRRRLSQTKMGNENENENVMTMRMKMRMKTKMK